MEKEAVARSPSKKRRRGRGYSLLKFLFIILAILGLVFLLRTFLAASVVKIQTLTSQEVSQAYQLEGLLVKEEKVVRAPAGGRLHFTVQDGNRLEVGAGVAQIEVLEQDSKGQVSVVATPYAGIFCTHIDGWESVLSQGILDVLELPRLEKINVRLPAEGGRLEKGL